MTSFRRTTGDAEGLVDAVEAFLDKAQEFTKPADYEQKRAIAEAKAATGSTLAQLVYARRRRNADGGFIDTTPLTPAQEVARQRMLDFINAQGEYSTRPPSHRIANTTVAGAYAIRADAATSDHPAALDAAAATQAVVRTSAAATEDAAASPISAALTPAPAATPAPGSVTEGPLSTGRSGPGSGHG